ncbi:hypothetical protein [Pseudomonas pseudonitroreducens]|uniref:hypothetical protein n=1 Tax=Pseudomonas pseudonitroreducens TaxID=2892326 RepID=UPI001F24B474|nr:hypothetical protein [Pseudomonas pseudonitroreducens]
MEEPEASSNWYETARQDIADPVFTSFRWNGRTTDWFLQELVSGVNRFPEARMNLTLFTVSGILSGTLISAEEYFRIFADNFCRGFDADETTDGIRNYYASLGTPPPKAEPEADEPIGEAPPQYIHLKDAKHFSPGGVIPNNEGLLWRGTIASISGFTLGQLQKG